MIKQYVLFYKENLKYLRESNMRKGYISLVFICSIFLASSNSLFSFMIQNTINSALENKSSKFVVFAVLFFVISLVYGFIFYLVQKYKEVIYQKIAKEIKGSILERIINMPILESQSYEQGKLLTILSEDADNFSKYFSYAILPTFQLLFSVFVGMIYIGWYSYVILIVIVLIAGIFGIINFKLSKRISSSYVGIQKIQDQQKSFFQDVHLGADIIKIYSLFPLIKHLLSEVSNNRIKAAVRHTSNKGKNSMFVEGSILGIELIILVIGIFQVRYSNLSLGALLGIWNASIGTLIYPFMDFPNLVAKLAETRTSWSRISLIEEKSENKCVEIGMGVGGRYSLCLSDITFSYPSSEYAVLKEINLTLHDNETIMVVGESGEGKSTLIKILLQLLVPTTGSVEVISDDSNNHFKNIVPFISYVPQDHFMIGTSLLENMTMGEEEPIEVVTKLMEEMNLESLEKNLSGEKLSLSLGQEQRVAIIRSLLKKSKFIVMDEPFSSLDDENASIVAKRLLDEKKKERGIIIISHRKVDSLKVDKTYELKGGRLHEI